MTKVKKKTLKWPRSPAHEKRLIEEAVKFIMQAEKQASYDFAMDIGGFLFNRTFDGDIELIESTNRWKNVALRRIARDRRVSISHGKLEASLKSYVLITRYPQRRTKAPVPDFPVWKWVRMWDLVHDPEMIYDMSEWTARRKASTDLVRELVQTVKPYVAAGGKFRDLLVNPQRIANTDTPYARVRRLLGVEKTWASRDRKIGKRTRRELLEIIEKIERRLEQP